MTTFDSRQLESNESGVVLSDRARSLLHLQGFVGVPDSQLIKWNLPLRWTPAIYVVGVSAGVILQSYVILWSLIPFALVAVITGRHPFDLIYRYGFQRRNQEAAIPRYPLQRRLSFGVASSMLAIAGSGFAEGYPEVGITAGLIVAVSASLNTFVGFCVPSWIYKMLFSRHL